MPAPYRRWRWATATIPAPGGAPFRSGAGTHRSDEALIPMTAIDEGNREDLEGKSALTDTATDMVVTSDSLHINCLNSARCLNY